MFWILFFLCKFLFALERRIVGDIFFYTDCFLLLKYLLYFFWFDLEVFTCVQMIFCLLNTSFSKILFYRNSYFRTDYVSVIKLSLLFVEFVIYRYYFHTVWSVTLSRRSFMRLWDYEKRERDCVIWLLEIMGKSFNENPTIPYGLQYPHSP